MFGNCKGCAAKDTTITALAEQIDWLRMQLGTPWLERRKADLAQQAEESPGWQLSNQSFVSDDESDIEHMLEQGLISPAAAEAALEQIGALSTEVTIG